MARGYPGAFGRKVNALVRVDPAVRAVRRAVHGPAAALPPAAPRPARPAGLLSVSLAFFNHGRSASRSRSPPRRWCTCWSGCSSQLSSAGAASRRACACPGTGSSRDGLPGRLPGRAQRHGRQRDRRRLLRRDRRRPNRPRQAAYGDFPRTTSTATPTGRSTTSPMSPSSCLSVEGKMGRPSRGARGARGLRCADHGRVVPARPAPRAAPARRGARLRMGGLPVDPVVSTSGANDSLVALLLVLLALLAAGRPPRGAARCARRADEVRAAAACAAVRNLPRGRRSLAPRRASSWPRSP